MKIQTDIHLFAIHVADCSNLLTTTGLCRIVDKELFHRVTRVLRLRDSDACILFDQVINVHAVLCSLEPKKMACTFDVLRITKNSALQPGITFLLPVLKKDALSTAIYSLVEMGVNKIQLVFTEKSRKSFDEKGLLRLQRVVVAAAEQAKYFAYPEILLPQKLSDALSAYVSDKTTSIFFDPEGQSIKDLLSEIDTAQSFVLLIGPEGDLAVNEKKLVADKMQFCALTPTILRASQAAALTVGIVRSVENRILQKK